ncbi:MAG: AsmA-like C-terminal region-containing protein, partial [Acetobacteraceae bacterium]|nr:AsmA-like C-terminal region-containing protein [Acetobacteraceae bacterium]
LEARGHGLAGFAATLGGSLEVTARDGQLIGYDLPAVQAAASGPDFATVEPALRGALAGGDGATAFERLEARARVADGVAVLEHAAIGTERGGAAEAEGRIDLARGTLDVTISTVPVADAPPIRLRLTGPATAPRRQPELAPFLRWKAERG